MFKVYTIKTKKKTPDHNINKHICLDHVALARIDIILFICMSGIHYLWSIHISEWNMIFFFLNKSYQKRLIECLGFLFWITHWSHQSVQQTIKSNFRIHNLLFNNGRVCDIIYTTLYFEHIYCTCWFVYTYKFFKWVPLIL